MEIARNFAINPGDKLENELDSTMLEIRSRKLTIVDLERQSRVSSESRIIEQLAVEIGLGNAK